VVIEWDGKIGTVIKDGVRKTGSGATGSGNKLGYSGSSYYGSVKNWLNVRDADGAVIGKITKGEVVRVLGTSAADPERVVIEWKNTKGTVLKSGLKKTSGAPAASGSQSGALAYSGSAYNAVITSAVNMRDADGDLICKVPRCAQVYVKGTSTKDKDRVVISYGGKVGTVLKSGVKKIKDAVFVDISAQKATLYKGGKVIAEAKCVTGTRGKSDTPKGAFRIGEMTRNKVFQPSGKKSSYWLRFYNGCGFHDATWRSSFGGSIYKSNGSNGCVNLPRSFAQTLYTNAYRGMPVYISE
jgi:lipoprotein-anchoring transpeptidase ErfK/SrfK